MAIARPLLLSLALIGLFLLAGTAMVRADDDRADPIAEGWRQFVGGEALFGDYSEAVIDSEDLPRARVLVFESCRMAREARTPAAWRLAARSLWAGLNLEYQAMLLADGLARKDLAWRTLATAGKLRELLAEHPILGLEEVAAVQDRWDQALLQLEAIEDEAAQEIPYATPTLARRVRAAVADEFRAGNTPAGGPNALLMEKVGGAFRAGETLAKRADAAAVQASLALGRVYGYPPEKQRAGAEPKLAPEEAAGGVRTRGLYPPKGGDPDLWGMIVRMIWRSYGGGQERGIVGDYAVARERLARGRPKEEITSDQLARLPADISGMKYGIPPELHLPYTLKELEDQAGKVHEAAIAKTPPDDSGQRFRRFEITPDGVMPEDGLAGYWAWFQEKHYDKRSAASVELEALIRDVGRAFDEGPGDGSSEPEAPLGNETIASLAILARSISRAPISEKDARSLVRRYLREWVESRVDELVPAGPVLFPAGDGRSKTTAEPRAKSGDNAMLSIPRTGGIGLLAALSMAVPAASGDGPEPFAAPRPRGHDEGRPPADRDGGPTDRDFVRRCLGRLRRGEPLDSGADASGGALARDRLARIADADERLRPVVAGLLAEDERLSRSLPSTDLLGRKVRERSTKGRRGESSPVDALLERETITAKAAKLAEDTKKVGDAAETIARLYLVWNRLQETLRMESSRSVDAVDDKKQVSGRLVRLLKEINEAPRYRPGSEEIKGLSDRLFSKKVAAEAPPAEGSSSDALILYERLRLESFGVVVGGLADRLRAGDGGSVAEARRLLEYVGSRYPPTSGERNREAYRRALKALEEQARTDAPARPGTDASSR